jgi:outer membrane receptor protein involved in Fe transport
MGLTAETPMKKTSLLGASTLFAVAVALAQPAYAQQAAQPCPDDDNDGVCNDDEASNDSSTILVTGTRIARPTLESAVPLTSVTPEDLTGTGEISLGDALNDLPSLRSTFSSGNSTRFIGTAGLSLLDLRGLGTDRTLVLVNGRRHVTSSPGDVGFDVNTIPIDLVERIDIVTGGNSAVYGSDAVAGVVNFVMRRDYDGLSIRGQGGISSRGDRGSYFMSAIWGNNFADGRGNITLSAEYSRAQPLLRRDREGLTGAFNGRCQFNASDPTAGEPAAGDGIPDATFFCGIRSGSISDGGTIGRVGVGSYLRFRDDGTLFVDTFTTNFEAFNGNGNGIGANSLGSTLNNAGSLLAEVNRYAFNAYAHFDFSDAFRPFIEAKFVRTEASGQGQPSFQQGSIPAFFGGGSAYRCNNGFLTAQALTTLQGFGLCTNVAAGTFNVSRFNIDFGDRTFYGRRDTFRVVGGIEGSFNDDWRYELAVNYGRFDGRGRNDNNLLLFDLNGNPDGYLLAVDAVLAPVGFTGTNFALNSTGQRVVCRVNAITNVRPDCIPINTFGQQNNQNPAAIDFINAPGTVDEFADQLVVSANVSGDFSQLFELPGGPISFAIGAEWRRERAGQDYDELTSSGATFLNALQDFNPPNLEVRDLYGELQFPLLDDLPFAHELVVTLAGRVSDYNNSTGTVYAYNIQGVWAPIEDVRFRVAYATSVRAPTQGDLFSPSSENFAQIADPCDQANILGGPNRVANCAAGGVPTTINAATAAACTGLPAGSVVGTPWVNCLARAFTTGFVSGGNPTLQEERGRSLTIGAVFEPRFLPGLNFTVDWYRIRVNNLIAALGAQTIINLCYDSATGLNNPFCATVSRNPTTGLFNEPAVISGGVNFASQRTSGMDFDLSYRRTFDNGQRLELRAIATRVTYLNNYTDPTQPLQPNRQLSELGDPQWAASFRVSYDFGSWDVLYSARYIGKQTIGAYETQNPYRGLCPASGITPNTGGINGTAVPCTAGQIVTIAPNNADAFPRINYPDVIYHDIRLGFDVGNDFRFYAGVSNLLDRQPPLGLLGTAGGDPFDSFGRNFFFGFSAEW